MDPFEVRLEFISCLKKLNASQPYIRKCVKYAIQNKGCYEDLHRCILEVMDQFTILPRLNLLYFIDALLENSKSINFKGYIELIRQDLNKLILDVTSGPNGVINITNTKRILLGWRKKKYFDKKVLDEAEEILLDKKNCSNHFQYRILVFTFNLLPFQIHPNKPEIWFIYKV
ncbi:2783_t:CDS:2 [Entrophospora sp. SA101]|nr:2783_t:CDS:2 [Entrophospora sp. SA101]